MNKKNIIGIIGLGYVGLPLALQFGKKFNVVGFDINKKRINQLKNKIDATKEVNKKYFLKSNKILFTSNFKDLKLCNIFIVTVPTPINKNKKPDLRLIKNASKTVGKILKKNDIVIYESTLFPGAVEEICVPILEKTSNLNYNVDFFCGYSPERINPGDKKHGLIHNKKITSGSTKKISNFIDKLYKKIIRAGTYKVKSIRIAEAAKVIENCQRDLNIAFINELSLIFDKLELDTYEILKAASTKWNFIDFRPGLVGGHCIGVDPYYLTYKANQVGYYSDLISSGRKINSSMGFYVAKKLIIKMKKEKISITNSKILIMGFSFKENCQDIRNTRVIDIITKLKTKKCLIDIYDPLINSKDCMNEYSLKVIKYPYLSKYDSIIIAVAHNVFKRLGLNRIKKFGKKKCIIFDVKNIFDNKNVDITL